MDNDILLKAEQILGHHFSDPQLLIRALTHSSSTDDRFDSNERLEFLGDSVLALVICQALFTRFPEYFEGDLTRIKSMLVSRKCCASIANEIGLTELIKAGKGMTQTRAINGSIAAGTLEAVIAAIYIDGGFERAANFIITSFEDLIEKADADSHNDNFKSMLQQYAQQSFGDTPSYELLDEKGPDHDKCFESCVVLDSRRFPSAWAVTKKEAEQKAARNALIELGLVKEGDV